MLHGNGVVLIPVRTLTLSSQPLAICVGYSGNSKGGARTERQLSEIGFSCFSVLGP